MFIFLVKLITKNLHSKEKTFLVKARPHVYSVFLHCFLVQSDNWLNLRILKTIIEFIPWVGESFVVVALRPSCRCTMYTESIDTGIIWVAMVTDYFERYNTKYSLAIHSATSLIMETFSTMLILDCKFLHIFSADVISKMTNCVISIIPVSVFRRNN